MILIIGANCGSQERRLLNHLLQFYNNLERPVYNESEAVDLRFGLTLQQIIDVVSPEQQWFQISGAAQWATR